MKTITIRTAENGFVVSATRGPLLCCTTARPEELGEKTGKIEILNLPEVAWVVTSADEAFLIARRLLEGGEVSGDERKIQDAVADINSRDQFVKF